MGFATFALVVCLTTAPRATQCTPPVPSGQLFEVDPSTIQANGTHNAYQACVDAANLTVEQGDKALSQYGMEVFVYKPREACKPMGTNSPGIRGDSTRTWGYGA